MMQNHDVLATWLEGHSYETNYRPIPIEEYLVYDGYIYPASAASVLTKTATQFRSTQPSTQTTNSAQPTRMIQSSSDKELKDPIINAVVSLASETVRAGYGVLVFASSRSGCEADAEIISKAMPGPDELDPAIRFQRLELLSDLRNLSTGIDPTWEKTIPYGVVFHRRVFSPSTSRGEKY